jgi:hypothetical protein
MSCQHTVTLGGEPLILYNSTGTVCSWCAQEATERELERWRHGVPIEGDYVCPHELEVTNLRADNAALRAEILGLKEEVLDLQDIVDGFIDITSESDEDACMNKIDPPALDLDARMLADYNHKVGPIGKIERRVVANMIHTLSLAGFHLWKIFDGDSETLVTDTKSAMELIFNLDDCYVYFEGKEARTHWVRLVMGNSGWDVINDYTCGNKFGTVMDAFDGEEYL